MNVQVFSFVQPLRPKDDPNMLGVHFVIEVLTDLIPCELNEKNVYLMFAAIFEPEDKGPFEGEVKIVGPDSEPFIFPINFEPKPLVGTSWRFTSKISMPAGWIVKKDGYHEATLTVGGKLIARAILMVRLFVKR